MDMNYAFPVLPKDSIVSSDQFIQCVSTPNPNSTPEEMLDYQAKATLQVLAMYVKLSGEPAAEGEEWPNPEIIAGTVMVEQLVHQFFDPEVPKKDAAWMQRSMQTLHKYNTAIMNVFSEKTKGMTMADFLNWIPHLVWIDGKIYQSPRTFTFSHSVGTPTEWVEGLGEYIKDALAERLSELMGTADNPEAQAVLQTVKESLGVVDSVDPAKKPEMNLAMVEVTMLASNGQGFVVPTQVVLVVLPYEFNTQSQQSFEEITTELAAMGVAQTAVVNGMMKYREIKEAELHTGPVH